MMKTLLLLVASVGVVCGVQPEYYESRQFLVEADQQFLDAKDLVGTGRAAEALNAVLAARHIDALKYPDYREALEDGVAPINAIDKKVEAGYKYGLLAEASCLAKMRGKVAENVENARRVAAEAEVIVCKPDKNTDESTDHRFYWLGVLEGITDTAKRLVAMERDNADGVELLKLAAGRAKEAFQELFKFVDDKSEYTGIILDRAGKFNDENLQKLFPINSTRRRSSVLSSIPEGIFSSPGRHHPCPPSAPPPNNESPRRPRRVLSRKPHPGCSSRSLPSSRCFQNTSTQKSNAIIL